MSNKPQDYRARFNAIAEMVDGWRSGDVTAIYTRLVELKLYSPHSHKADCSYKINETISDLRRIDAIIKNHKGDTWKQSSQMEILEIQQNTALPLKKESL